MTSANPENSTEGSTPESEIKTATDGRDASRAGGDLLLARTFRLARKELREILRDRRTIITLVLMPLLVYPLLGVIMRKGLLSGLDGLGKVEVHLCVQSADDAAAVRFALQQGDFALAQDPSTVRKSGDAADPAQAVSGLLNTGDDGSIDFHIHWPENSSEAAVRYQVEEGFSDLGILLQISPANINDDGSSERADRSGRRNGDRRNNARQSPRVFRQWQLIHRSQSTISDRAFEEVTRRLDAVNQSYVDLLLRQNGLSPRKPAQYTAVEVEGQGTGGYSLITFIPLVLVLMTMTGAVYPAIDLTAGERERGTMEILVAAPVSRMTLLAGKFMAVLVVALLTASVNMLSMFATLFSLGLEEAVLGDAGWKVIPLIVVMMIVFAAFFSAVLLSLTSVARSFKEAQAYLIPLMLVSLTPGVFSLMPNLKMNTLLAVTPLANTVLLGRDLLQGYFDPVMFAVVLISTTVYGLLALSLAARIFGSDAVLYGSGGSWSDLIRRPEQPQKVAPIYVVWTALAIVFPLFLIANSLPGRLNASMTLRFLATIPVAVGIFLLVPFLLLRLTRVSPLTGFALALPRWPMVLVAVLLGLSLWPFIYEVNLLLSGSEQIERLKELYGRLEIDLDAVPLLVKLLCLAVIPAMTEEFFFRGFLQNTLRTRFSASAAIVSSALLFGLFHVIVRDALFFERFIPTMLMGLVLGIVFEKSASVLPGMLLHVLHNGLLITISQFEDRLQEMGIGTAERQHLPVTWIVAAAVPVVIASVIVWRHRRAATETRPGV